MSAVEKRAGGRPTVLSDEVIEALVLHMKLGFTPGQSARAAGIGPRTLRRWRSRAWSRAPEDRAYVELERRLHDAQVKEARAEGLVAGLWSS
jgi:hypothetical protein